VPGSIVANPGFVAQFSTMRNAAGKQILDPQIVGAWGGVQSGAQIITQYLGGFVSDRYGRKSLLYAFIFVLAGAAALEITATNWQMYMGARVFTGMAVACVQSVSTVYLSEVS
jgi:MFS family permease